MTHQNGASFNWVCEEDDSGYVNMKIGDEVLDSADFVMNKNVNCFGYVTSKVHYEINELDKPAGTTFHRLRIPQNAEYSYVEAILEDGRVMRVVEEYWFSEPKAYQATLDKDANQFDYSTVQVE